MCVSYPHLFSDSTFDIVEDAAEAAAEDEILLQ